MYIYIYICRGRHHTWLATYMTGSPNVYLQAHCIFSLYPTCIFGAYREMYIFPVCGRKLSQVFLPSLQVFVRSVIYIFILRLYIYVLNKNTR